MIKHVKQVLSAMVSNFISQNCVGINLKKINEREGIND